MKNGGDQLMALMTRVPLRQQVAAKIGAMLGPPSDSGLWADSFTPIWPDSYTAPERRLLVMAADAVIELIRADDALAGSVPLGDATSEIVQRLRDDPTAGEKAQMAEMRRAWPKASEEHVLQAIALRISQEEHSEAAFIPFDEMARAHRNKVARARRLLRKWDLKLSKQKGRYVVADDIGVPHGAPFERPIDEVLAWIAKTPSRSVARGEVAQAAERAEP